MRRGLTMSLMLGGLSLLVIHPAAGNELDDMLKKYPNTPLYSERPLGITNKEAAMLNAIRRHVNKLYGKINTAAQCRKLSDVQASQQLDRVGSIETQLIQLEKNASDKLDRLGAMVNEDSPMLSYGDIQTLVFMVGQAEDDLNDLLNKSQPCATVSNTAADEKVTPENPRRVRCNGSGKLPTPPSSGTTSAPASPASKLRN